MKIDFDHWKGMQIAEDIQKNLVAEYDLNLFRTLNPKFGVDGDQYCYIYGDVPSSYVAGFGDTPFAAMQDFIKNFYQDKINKTK